MLFSRESFQPRERNDISYSHALHWLLGSLPLVPHGQPMFIRVNFLKCIYEYSYPCANFFNSSPFYAWQTRHFNIRLLLAWSFSYFNSLSKLSLSLSVSSTFTSCFLYQASPPLLNTTEIPMLSSVLSPRLNFCVSLSLTLPRDYPGAPKWCFSCCTGVKKHWWLSYSWLAQNIFKDL